VVRAPSGGDSIRVFCLFGERVNIETMAARGRGNNRGRHVGQSHGRRLSPLLEQSQDSHLVSIPLIKPSPAKFKYGNAWNI
jgi:hypothetical protein